MFLMKKIVSILIGSLLLSMGINFFLVPFQLLDGGMIGLGLIISYVTGLKAGFIIIMMSIPVFVLAWFHNRHYFYNSLHGMLFSSLIIDFLYPLHDPFIRSFHLSSITSSIIGGIFIGIGMGMMLRFNTSTGGTDLLAQLLAKGSRINVGILIFIIDAFIIGIGGLIFSIETVILSAITISFVGLFTSIWTWNMRYE
ncbi:YitT family protein [Aquibacillus sediminis]|uniref:YitT family protein n=1 Tax=Aquibacillus sediminis TaxID=2574734 RepID=UPI0011089B72|nr:YitT family protein [Aquibacillus sediminis]